MSVVELYPIVFRLQIGLPFDQHCHDQEPTQNAQILRVFCCFLLLVVFLLLLLLLLLIFFFILLLLLLVVVDGGATKNARTLPWFGKGVGGTHFDIGK